MLLALRTGVEDARIDVGVARRVGTSARDLRAAQRGLLAALERYATALTAAGLAAPHELRSELATLRSVFGEP